MRLGHVPVVVVKERVVLLERLNFFQLPEVCKVAIRPIQWYNAMIQCDTMGC